MKSAFFSATAIICWIFCAVRDMSIFWFVAGCYCSLMAAIERKKEGEK